MENNNTRDRVSKRTLNACVRCRRQKTKCSGSHPCDSCAKRQLVCEFDQRDQRIIVTRGYIMDLQQAIQGSGRHARRRSSLRDTPESAVTPQTIVDSGTRGQASRQAAAYDTPTSEVPESPTRSRNEQQEPIESASSAIDNPLSLRHAQFTTSSSGAAYYLGTSSNWSFTRRVLLLTHEHLGKAPLPAQTLIFDGAGYNIDWENVKKGSDHSIPSPALPALDHALYLINTVKFNCGQLFHLFDEDDFMESCYRFYADPNPDSSTANSLWYLHFCLIVALGKALVSRRQRDKLPFGSEFFMSAMRNLPDMGLLIQHPIAAMEVLSCAALYLQCIDHRHYAHILAGQALRIGLFQGIHIEMPAHQLGSQYVERCRRVWWTVYVLDRDMATLMGNPPSIADEDIACPLPAFSGSPQRVATFDMQVKLCRLTAHINKKLYGNSGNLHFRYLARAKEVLASIADLADDLRTSFPLQPKEAMSGMSRTASHLHLLHHRCLTLATRPLLFYLLKQRFASPENYLESLNSMQTVRNLVHMCVDASQQMISILDCLLNQGLLHAFFPYDLEAVFVATTILLLGPAVDPEYSHGCSAWLRKAYAVFDDMINYGNMLAQYRKAELLQLDEMLSVFRADATQHQAPGLPPSISQPSGAAATVNATSGTAAVPQDAFSTLPRSSAPTFSMDMSPSTMETLTADTTSISHADGAPSACLDSDPMSGDLFDAGFTREQILGMADAIGDDDMAWMCDTIKEHSVW